ncbi:MAG: hypothetical protein ABJP02_17770 [Parasphingorhabdus sp.]|uniref:hypothetical protein n=1 Tax=Parasphingorhabdus sp. TaxID=2709688 RepID=UPI0032975C3F
MNSVLKLLMGMLVFAAWPSIVKAQTSSCAVSYNIPYCQYIGKLKHVYINEGRVMLFYLEQPMDIALPASVGYTGVSNGSAVTYNANVDPVFAEYFYSTALTALAGDKTISIQMRQTVGGYMKVDRIWLHK